MHQPHLLLETVHRDLENMRDGHEPKSPIEERLIRHMHAVVSVLIMTSGASETQMEFNFQPVRAPHRSVEDQEPLLDKRHKPV